MDHRGEIHRMGSLNLMRTGSSMWSRRGEDMFSSSQSVPAVGDDDEDALREAAMQKMPSLTFNRMHNDEKEVLEKLLQGTEENHEKLLNKLRDRINRAGINLPSIEVRFENLNIEAEVYVGSSGVPTVTNSTINTIEALANALHIIPSRKRPMPILHNVSGIIKPRRMTLLLGPPGSGKTTLLLALAGKLDSDLKMSGKVTYNGHEMSEFVPERTAAYISQHDLHLGQMTVRETLEFSARCQGVGTRYDTMTELARREKEAHIKPDPDVDVFLKAFTTGGSNTSVVTDYIVKLLGLDVCADTMVGNDIIRGISGGQRKRVTTGEIVVGPSRVLLMDEISTGLDSSTTYQIVNVLRASVHILQGTAVVSLLQPAPETYDLFDDIILLSDGQIVYQGPRERVLEFFESVGFKCPDRKGVADFLQEVTSRKDQEQYWARNDIPYRYVPVRKFAEAFSSFHVGQNMANELAVPFDKSTSHPSALTTSKYGVSNKELFMTNIKREILLMKRESFIYIFTLCQLAIMAFITSTVFLRTNMHRNSITDGGLYMGSLFFSIIITMLNGYVELALTIAKLPVFFKQRNLRFYPAWSYALPSWILKIPISLVEVGVWVFTVYYIIGFDPSVARLFKQYLILLGINQMSSGLFRFIGGLSRNMILANTFASFVLLIMLVLGGFILSRENIKKWWIWAYWISPVTYAQNGLSTNEFLSHSWDKILPGSNKTLGTQVLESRGVFAEARWYWIGVGVLVGFVLLFNALYTLALTYVKPFGKSQPTVSEEMLKEKHANLTGEVAEGSSRGGKSHTAAQVGDALKDSASISVQDRTDLGQGKEGMVIPFKPLALTFDNIRYSVDIPAELKAQGVQEDRLVLLKGVSSSFRPGVLTALMGVSGAGKTTLMDVLAGRKTGGNIEGSITISGYPKKQETFARVSGYCEQNDIHSPHLTVYESLVFSAWLRLSSNIDFETRERFVKQVMELVELNSLRDSLVGLPGVNGLSTEQRKRLTIAVELVANPSIIFMDEPTSGLDARAAAIVMRAVRNTVDTGRTVVCTIHQPSIDIFEAFDELLLMKRGGEEIYVGPLGRNSAQLIKYFESIQGVSKIKGGNNPATWMLEVTTSAQEEALGVNFSEVYKNSELYRRNKALIKELSTTPDSSDLHFKTKYSQPFFIQCLACLWKQRLSYWRNPPYTAVRFFFTTAIAVVFGTIFWDLGSKIGRRQDLFNAMGSMYASVIFIGIQNAQSVQPVVAIERTVFYREKAAGMYFALPYAFGQVAIEIPYIFVQALVFAVIVYAMIGFEWTAAKFFWFLFFMYFTMLYHTFYGMMAVGLTPNHQVASIVSSSLYSIWNLFSGFLIPRPQLPVWWRWYAWICPVAWTLYGLVSSQFGDVPSEIEGGQTVAEFVRSYFGFHHDLLGVVAAVVVSFAVFFAFMFGFAIQKLNFQKR